MNIYGNAAVFWDTVFQKEDTPMPENAETGNEQLDKGLVWLTQNTKSVLNFGDKTNIDCEWKSICKA